MRRRAGVRRGPAYPAPASVASQRRSGRSRRGGVPACAPAMAPARAALWSVLKVEQCCGGLALVCGGPARAWPWDELRSLSKAGLRRRPGRPGLAAVLPPVNSSDFKGSATGLLQTRLGSEGRGGAAGPKRRPKGGSKGPAGTRVLSRVQQHPVGPIRQRTQRPPMRAGRPPLWPFFYLFRFGSVCFDDVFESFAFGSRAEKGNFF